MQTNTKDKPCQSDLVLKNVNCQEDKEENIKNDFQRENSCLHWDLKSKKL